MNISFYLSDLVSLCPPFPFLPSLIHSPSNFEANETQSTTLDAFVKARPTLGHAWLPIAENGVAQRGSLKLDRPVNLRKSSFKSRFTLQRSTSAYFTSGGYKTTMEVRLCFDFGYYFNQCLFLFF